jgi:hypothetical protein
LGFGARSGRLTAQTDQSSTIDGWLADSPYFGAGISNLSVGFIESGAARTAIVQIAVPTGSIALGIRVAPSGFVLSWTIFH